MWLFSLALNLLRIDKWLRLRYNKVKIQRMYNMEYKKLIDITLHKLTETHPVMSVEQFQALTKDIEENGQLQPVLVYRGKIVDGRHRYKALTLLGSENIKVEVLANNLSLDDVVRLVNSTEMRRHQSPTQLAIKGYRLYKLGKYTQREVISRAGCSLSNLKYVVLLESLGRLDVVELLESGGKFDVSRDSRFNKMTDSLLAITSYVKEEIARIEALQIEGDDEEDKVRSKISKEEYTQLQVVDLLMSSWSPEMKKVLVAKIYSSLN